MNRTFKVIGTYILRTMLCLLYVVAVLGVIALLNDYILKDAVQISEFMKGVFLGILMPPITKMAKLFDDVDF